MSQGTDYKSVCLPNILNFLDQQCFPKVTKLISSLNCDFRFSMFVIKIVKT